MTSYDRMKALCEYHGIKREEFINDYRMPTFRPGEISKLGYYPTHKLLDELDKKIGVDTRNGMRHDSYCSGTALPHNQVGTRIRLHEEYIRKDEPPCLCVGCFPSGLDNHHFWLGREG